MFSTARISLTAWYLTIIMLISLAFSAVIYGFWHNELSRIELTHRLRIERGIKEGRWGPQDVNVFTFVPLADREIIVETRKRILLMLLLTNIGIFIVSGAIGYLLAGQTLLPIQQMVEEQNRFVSDSSHELRTPLTSLKSAFEVYLRDPKPKAQDTLQLITDSLEEVARLQSLSDSLLHLSRVTSASQVFDSKVTSLEPPLESVVAKLSPQAKLKSISLDLEVVSEPQIIGNKYYLEELFTILLDNAIKYSHRSSTVTIRLFSKANTAVIEIIDLGIGIPRKDISHIFDRFYRSDSARSQSDIPGFGLGLSIAQNIVHLHKGTISVSSLPGKGTKFTVQIPLYTSRVSKKTISSHQK